MTTPTLLKPFNVHRLWITFRGISIVTPWIFHLFVTDLALSALLPLSFIFPTACYNLSSYLASLVWRGIQYVFTKKNQARITKSGTPLPPHESAIIVANHVSWTDFYLIQQIAIDCGMLGRCRWFAKQQLKWVPFLGWGLWAMGMPLVSREWAKDKKEMERVFWGPKALGWPIWLVSYSEATRYTPQKYLETVQWCKSNDKPVPRFTLYPRTKGFVSTVQQLRKTKHVMAVYDVTIAYAHEGRFMEAPDLWETLSQPSLKRDWKFHVHADRHALQALPESDDELAKWLETRWIEKGKRLEGLQQELEGGRPWGESRKEM